MLEYDTRTKIARLERDLTEAEDTNSTLSRDRDHWKHVYNDAHKLLTQERQRIMMLEDQLKIVKGQCTIEYDSKQEAQKQLETYRIEVGRLSHESQQDRAALSLSQAEGRDSQLRLEVAYNKVNLLKSQLASNGITPARLSGEGSNSSFKFT